ncbi:hypothetical protein GCM10027052_02530 [Parafrigoribacterium mesophilum]|uniref:hypothetical protein n=1 Tax=Parafrigoribacterium mesophilum TaxID=433646 RepID=UPI0031FD2C8B
MVLGLFVSAASLGVYSIAMPIAGLIWIVSEALSLFAFDNGGKFTSVIHQRRRFVRLTTLNMLFGTVGAVVIALASIFVIPEVLPQYAGAVPLVLILLPGVLVQGYARIGLSIVFTTDSRRAPVVIGMASAALSVLYIPFVIGMGTIGAAIASSVIYVLQMLVVGIVLRALLNRMQTKESQSNA